MDFDHQKTLWVDPNGNDTSAVLGRFDLPWQTIEAAVAHLRLNTLIGYTIIVMPGSYTPTSPPRFDSLNAQTTMVLMGGVVILMVGVRWAIGDGAIVSIAGLQHKYSGPGSIQSSTQLPGAHIISQNGGMMEIVPTVGSVYLSIHNVALTTKTSGAPSSSNSILDLSLQNEQTAILIDNCSISIDDSAAGLTLTRQLGTRNIFEMYDTSLYHQGTCLDFTDAQNASSQLYYRIEDCTFTSGQSNIAGTFGHIDTNLISSQNCFGTLSGNGFYDTNSSGTVYIHNNAGAVNGLIDSYSSNVTTGNGLLNMNYLTPGIPLLAGQALNDPQFFAG